MEEQAGVYKIVLYEDKDLSYVYSGGDIVQINNTSTSITLENSDCDTQELNYSFEYKRSPNNRLRYKNKITWLTLGLNDENIEQIRQIKQSIYGWIALIEFYNGLSKVIKQPLRFMNSAINNNLSNSYSIEIMNPVFGGRLIDASLAPAGTVTADSNTVTADSNTVDASGGSI
jgi:hypothetical protein